jgi:hypothetical protein
MGNQLYSDRWAIGAGEPAAPGGPALGAALMLHPARHPHVRRIAAACAPLPLDVTVDPDPQGPPSPLRTARLAWSAVRDGVTHHLVLQDDVVLACGFARHLRELVTRWPGHAIALYVNWNSPYNSYRVRCAAVAGRPWAPLAPWEWIPTLGLVLPAGHARGLAAYLATLPDSCAKDDYAVTWYCTAHNIRVLAAVPHLLEHGAGPSLAGNEHQGERRATVAAGPATPGAGHWRRAGDTRDRWHLRQVSVSVIGSRCYLRHWRLDGEPSLDRTLPERAHWARRCHLLGVSPEQVTGQFRGGPGDRGGAGERAVALEFWAAGFLLGADVGRTAGEAPRPEEAAALRRECLRTWVRSGLDAGHRDGLGAGGERWLVDVCAEAVERGIEWAGR